MKIDRKYLPSKNFLIALSIAIVIIIIAVIVSSIDFNSKKQDNSNLESVFLSTLTKNNTDSDEDGLTDWLETLYGTNPNKKDTDDDGTTDGQEIKEQRDPAKANTAKEGETPNDKIDPIIIEQDKSMSDEYEKLNPTEKLARNIISDIMASQPVSGTMDEETMNTIINKTLNEIPQKEFTGITKIEDLNFIKIDKNTISRDLGIYKNSYYKETEILRKILGTDLLTMSNYMIKEEEINEEEFSKVIEKYQSVVNNLVKMPLPANTKSAGAYYHLMMINDIEKIIAIDKDIVKSKNDNLSVLSNLSLLNKTLTDLVSTLQVIDVTLDIKRT
ncbi:MAG: thrombospondin type 3 repeat-containing protein [Candidatus Pacebacteria bacterium]|nr:thrombospondin type 3 repeat-containing protein [Candidatus Paceibacterota bacterium]